MYFPSSSRPSFISSVSANAKPAKESPPHTNAHENSDNVFIVIFSLYHVAQRPFPSAKSRYATYIMNHSAPSVCIKQKPCHVNSSRQIYFNAWRKTCQQKNAETRRALFRKTSLSQNYLLTFSQNRYLWEIFRFTHLQKLRENIFLLFPPFCRSNQKARERAKIESYGTSYSCYRQQ